VQWAVDDVKSRPVAGINPTFSDPKKRKMEAILKKFSKTSGKSPAII
jgi:hypothetical protein